MKILVAFLIAAGSLFLTLFSYVNSVYREKGRFLVRGSKDNVDFFEEHIEPLLKISVEQAELTFPLLIQFNVILLALLVISWNLGLPLHWPALLQDAIFVGLDLVMFAEVLPKFLLARTRGKWLIKFSSTLRASALLVYPLVAISQFLHNFATLGSYHDGEQSEPTVSENIEALMLAGEEEGLLEKEDRK